MLEFCISAWHSGFRSRSIHAILVLGVLLVGVAFLSSSFSPRQPATVALDFGFTGIRFSLLLFGLFLVQDLIGREVERKTVMYALSYPVSRASYLVGRYLGIISLLALSAVALALLLWTTTFAVDLTYDSGNLMGMGSPFWMTVFGLWVDAALVAAFALWIASFSTVSMLPVALGAAFAISGKTLGAVMDYLSRGADNDAELVARFTPIINAVKWILPDLSRLDWRMWPMYELNPGFSVVALSLLMAVSYTLILLSLAVFTFARREFS
ncbi:MAG: ABC transporter permease subunit [Candidatus Accumulibacter sp.]|jgi:ABC-type transport system involved in multi-copper enzyme maturation permease subunit|nr:ABC transporter permease subunit [Accumulibacter sp.]